MMPVKTLALSGLFLVSSISAYAQAGDNDYFSQQANSNSQDLVKYLKNLGAYLGYDVTQFNQDQISQQLLNSAAVQLTENYLYITVMGAIPVNAMSQVFSSFVPNNTAGFSALNSYANMTFASQPYNNPAGTQQGKVSVVQSVDQTNYQPDPVNQAILNLLSTPDISYCQTNDGSSMLPNCNYLVQNSVVNNVIGNVPDPRSYFSYSYNQQVLGQLNSNSLIAPLMYSMQNTSASSTSSGGNNQGNQGLTAQNQAQQAANFIRYVSSTVVPPNLPKFNDYSTLYLQAINSGGNVSPMEQMTAQSAISSYLANLRSYVAQTSVGLSNLYYILSKRMPQNLGGDNNTSTSEALSEFTMATWRLYNPDMSANKQWINQVNQASSATIQKEMLTLLAEINYQLYLNRQQEERILMTNSILLLQNAKASQPGPQLTIESGTPSNP